MWGVSLTYPVLSSFLCGEFLLHIPCWLHFFIFYFICGLSLKHTVLVCLFLSFFPVFILWEESLTHLSWLHFYVGSFSYTSHAGLMFIWGVSLTHPVLFFYFNIYYFLFYLGSFTYTPRAGFIFVWGVTCPILVLLFCGEFLLHIPCWVFLCGKFLLHIPCWLCFYVGSFSYTSRCACIFKQRSLSYTSRAEFVFLFCFLFLLFLSGAFLFHIPCWLHFYIGSFSYTSDAAFKKNIFGSFSYTSRAGFIFIWVVPLKHTVWPSFLCGEFLLHIPCCFLSFFFSFSFFGSFCYTSIPCGLHFHLGRSS